MNSWDAKWFPTGKNDLEIKNSVVFHFFDSASAQIDVIPQFLKFPELDLGRLLSVILKPGGRCWGPG